MMRFFQKKAEHPKYLTAEDLRLVHNRFIDMDARINKLDKSLEAVLGFLKTQIAKQENLGEDILNCHQKMASLENSWFSSLLKITTLEKKIDNLEKAKAAAVAVAPLPLNTKKKNPKKK